EARGATLDAYLVGTGGGGLIAGSSLVFTERSSETALYSVEPEGRDDHDLSLEAGERIAHAPNPAPTICDALLPPIPGEMTFAINKKHLSGGFRVSEDEVRSAMRFAFENLKIVAEPGGCVALAAVLSGKLETRGKKIGLIITGGNVDPAQFREILG
ncbi:MAG: pyridoxal-phosphate dependent enzyme, partial [Sphingomonadales bacterium]